MTQPVAPLDEPAPRTGNSVVDAAVEEFGSLRDHAAHEHHDRLAQLSDVLSSVLDSSRDAVQTPIPGLPPGAGSGG